MAALGGSLGISADNENHTAEPLTPGHDLKTGQQPNVHGEGCSGWGG